MSIATDDGGFDRTAAVRAYRAGRARTADLFALLEPAAYYAQPIELRHPLVFYDGHIPAFAVNCLLRKGLGGEGVDPELDQLFARGIDPDDGQAAAAVAIDRWPSRAAVRDYVQRADRALLTALETDAVAADANAVLRGAQGVHTLLEHEVMHQETLLYLYHRLDFGCKRRPAGAAPVIGGAPPAQSMVPVAAGRATLGSMAGGAPFGWDNEFPAHAVDVAAFEIQRYNVTNRDYLAFVEAGGYRRRELWAPAAWRRQEAAGRMHPLFWEQRGGAWTWRGMFESVPLPPAWPVYVTRDEAAAYAAWRGLRLPTEAEFHRAAYGEPGGGERPHPWGAAGPDASRGNFDFAHWDPVPVGSYPAGASGWGVHDLVGNGWEWTTTVFDGFPGFEPMASYPEYSADFFDGAHYVVKGASPATGRGLIRRSFRNWFRPHYPYAYATFRCARDGDAADC